MNMFLWRIKECNCLFCSSESNFDKCNIVDFETFKKTINYFISLGGIEEISFSGGEPMLHPNIYDMVEFCSNFLSKVPSFVLITSPTFSSASFIVT